MRCTLSAATTPLCVALLVIASTHDVAALPASASSGRSSVFTQIFVPEEQPSIQLAIAAAASGDHVVVSPGFYSEHLDFLGKDVIVRSTGGAAATVIDGTQSGIVVTFATGETSAARLEGFTIRNGRGTNAPIGSGLPGGNGGGIVCLGASPTLVDCVIELNAAGRGAPASLTANPGDGGHGGGLYSAGGSPTLIGCTVRENAGGRGGGYFDMTSGGNGGHGGGVFFTGGTLTIQGGVLALNVSGAAGSTEFAYGGDAGDGGGIHGSNGTLVLEGVMLSGNRGANAGFSSEGDTGDGGSGGALWLSGVAADVTGCRFEANRAGSHTGGYFLPASGPGSGGAIYSQGGSLDLTRCRFVNNTAGTGASHGGAGAFDGSDGGSGGAIFATGTLIALHGCQLTGNRAGNGGSEFYSGTSGDGGSGGALAALSGSLAMDFCTFAGNRVGFAGGVDATDGVGGAVYSTAPVAPVTNTILWNSAPGSPVAGSFDINYSLVQGGWPGAGILTAHPAFANQTAGDYRLGCASPCIDAGVVIANAPTFDLDGDPRPLGAGYDIGADEYVEAGLLPGSSEDFILQTEVDGGGALDVSCKAAFPGDAFAMSFSSPGGTFVGTPPVLLGQVRPTGTVTSSLVGFTEVHVNPLEGPVAVLFDGVNGSLLGPFLLGSGGLTLQVVVPASLSGWTARLQALAFTSLALNGIFAASNAHDLTIL